MLRDLGRSADLCLRADSSAAIGICQRSGLGRVRHLAVAHLWIQEKIREAEFRLLKVLGTKNPTSEAIRRPATAARPLQETSTRLSISPGTRSSSIPYLQVY